MARKYSFPIIDSGEILTILEELGIEFRKKDLEDPQPEKIRQLFETFYENLTADPVDELETPSEIIRDFTDFPGLHDESIPVFVFFRAFRELLGICGVTDFSIRDLVRPTRRRLIVHLSALFNFVRFRELHLKEYQELALRTESRIEALQAAQTARDELRIRVKELQDSARELDAGVQPAEEKVARLESEVRELGALYEKLAQTTRDLEMHAQRVSTDLAARTDEISAATAAVTRLSTRIVGADASRVTDQVARLEAEARETETELEALRSDARHLRARSTALEDASASLRGVLDLLREASDAAERVRRVRGGSDESLHTVNGEIATLDRRRATLEADLQALEGRTRDLASRLRRSEDAENEELERNAAELTAARDQLETAQRESQRLENEFASLEEEEGAARSLVGKLRSETEGDIKRLNAKTNELALAFKQRAAAIAALIQ
eukprot:gnl/Chilomastix_cuspidata/2422.p1 GENE.gnl/Chilomastix_cuspidata/2422~~gnl/Chilomastix_cuspidata/2422.p1  ORF type:complete len:452 (+),score=99.49 gnl/Chilomastix_cuspidata/2422:30-1358(+)